MKKQTQSKLRFLIARIIKEEKIREDWYDERKDDDNWQFETITESQADYLEEKINDEFAKDDEFLYINWIESFPESADGSMLFIVCVTDRKPIKTRTFRCKNIQGDGLEMDGALSSHEPGSKVIYDADLKLKQ